MCAGPSIYWKFKPPIHKSIMTKKKSVPTSFFQIFKKNNMVPIIGGMKLHIDENIYILS